METKNLTKKIEVDYVVKDKWHFPVHQHTYYELQYIVRGKGQHIINGYSFTYTQGDIFMVSPQDYHYFVFSEKSTICFIKFNEGYFDSFLQDKDFAQLLNNLSSSRRKILLSSSCRRNISELIQLIMTTYKKASMYQDIILKNTLGLILALMTEDINVVLAKPKDKKIQEILKYIDQHINDKNLLSTKNISDVFAINKTYFNQYFRKSTGSSFKKYIQEYALNLIAQSLIYQDKTLSQLAFEFGYSDESHLSKAFKSHFKQTPSSFRQKYRLLF